MSDNQQSEWDKAYQNKNNFLFYPHEEVIRFCSKYIAKRIGLEEFQRVAPPDQTRVLDLGCGVGRHVVYFHDVGVESYGVDLSATAVDFAKRWAAQAGVTNIAKRIVQADIRQLPWPENTFDFAVSHGVLDSMHFEIARAAVAELSRVMTATGLFYCDLISGDDREHFREFAAEVTVSASHEQGTIQSYFNYTKILELFAGKFQIVEAVIIKREGLTGPASRARYHLVLKNHKS